MISRLILTAVVGATLATSALAQGRPDARRMSCGQVQSLVQQRGAVVMTTGQYTYDRFVANRSYCDWPMVPTATRIGTTDTNACPVYNCQRANDMLFDRRRD